MAVRLSEGDTISMTGELYLSDDAKLLLLGAIDHSSARRQIDGHT